MRRIFLRFGCMHFRFRSHGVIADLFDRDPGARIGRGGRQREAHDERKGQDQRKQLLQLLFHTFSSFI